MFPEDYRFVRISGCPAPLQFPHRLGGLRAAAANVSEDVESPAYAASCQAAVSGSAWPGPSLALCR